MSDDIKEFEMEIMEPEMMTESDKTKGINQPGLTQGVTYVDCNGNTRHKYETLEVLSNRGTTNTVESDEKVKNEVEVENIKEPIETVTEITKPSEPKDTVDVDDVVVEEKVTEVKPEPKPKATPKPKPKATPKKTPVKK